MAAAEAPADDTAAVAVGHRIRTLRDAHGLTQGALAAKVFVTQPAVSQWERGETMPGRATQDLLADALRTTRHRLFKELLAARGVAA